MEKDEEAKERRRACMKKFYDTHRDYYHTDEYREKKKAYYQLPEVKARIHAFYHTPNQKKKKFDYQRIWTKSPKRKMWLKKYRSRKDVKKRLRATRQKYYQKSETKEQRRNYLKMNLTACVAYRLRRRLQATFKTHGTRKTQVSKKYGIDWNAIIKHLGPMPNDGKKYDIDHLVPLSYFDFHYPEHIRAAFLPENHQWLEHTKNMEKGDRIIQLP